MSNEMFQGETEFKIELSQELAARIAMGNLAKRYLGDIGERAIAIRKQEREVHLPIDQFTLDELVEAFGWEIRRTDDGPPDEIYNIALQDTFSSQEDELFEALAPFVTSGSKIVLFGKGDNKIYWEKRYTFAGGIVKREVISPELPDGYTIGTNGELSYAGNPKLIVLLNGTPTDHPYWHMERKDAVAAAWGDYYGKVAETRNEKRKEIDHVLAWRIVHGESEDDVYTADHLKFYIPFGYLEEVTINDHGSYPDSSRYFISNMLCACCGSGAVDFEILSKYHLLNEDDWDEEEGE